ncbi:hypothetical protein AMS68_000795 [Peltaster fructicola]|uniref:FAD-binding PCMH-type domain-containing protein n=1 Tax=Peltaster fructicola TaxID=286661 RepID=A0A6H0XKW5_9PEZI|nr:hypothetical protein AMS68_000795 [Peltaster fructicola]
MSCCGNLANIGLQIALPDTASYNSTLAAYWSIQEASLAPACIATPQHAQDVAEIITALTTQGSCSGEAFAIKSHGHSPAAGFANIGSSGLTIDLTSLSSITYDHDSTIASVGSGASWVDVYAALDPYGKSVAGGRNGAVGVGGLTLGGGISYFSPQVGFTCDTVVNFELVLASGKLVNANASSNADLFKVLKGGGNNFGVVTRSDFQTVDIGQIMAAAITHPSSSDSRKAVWQAFANLANAPTYDVHASLVTGLIFNATARQWVLSSTAIYTLPELSPPAYDELFSAPNITSKRQLVDLHTFSNESATPPLNWLFRTGTYGASAALLEQFFDIYNQTLFDFQPAGTMLWSISFEPLPSVFTERGAGQNVLGTSGSDGDGMIVLLSALWTSSAESSAIQAKADDVLGQMNAAAESGGFSKQYVYANYAGAAQKPYQSYGRDNERLLYQASRKYDPHGVFQQRVPGGFKLSTQHGHYGYPA